jgi:hypothetical protein
LFGFFGLLFGRLVFLGFGEAEFDQWDDEEGHFVCGLVGWMERIENRD